MDENIYIYIYSLDLYDNEDLFSPGPDHPIPRFSVPRYHSQRNLRIKENSLSVDLRN